MTLAKANADAPLQLSFEKGQVDGNGVVTSWGDAFTSGPNSLSVDAENLVIISATASDGNVDFVRFDPESDNVQLNSPTVTFIFKDGDYQLGDLYHWQAFFPETGDTTSPATIGTLSSVEPINVPVPTSAGRGVYGFGIIIDKVRGTGHDVQHSRSIRRFFSDTKLTCEGDTEDADPKLMFSYRITKDNDESIQPRPIAHARIKALSGELEYGGSVDGPVAVSAVNDADHVVEAPTSDDVAGEGRVIATGEDDEADATRDHSRKHMLPLNKVLGVYHVQTLIGWKSPLLASISPRTRLLETGSNHAIKVIFDARHDIYSEPREVWDWMAKDKTNTAKKGLAGNYRPTVFNILGSATASTFDIGLHQSAFGVQSPAIWTLGQIPVYLNPSGTIPNYNMSLSYPDVFAPNDYPAPLNGTSFVNAMGSNTMTGPSPTTPGSGIARDMGRGAQGAIGYGAEVEGRLKDWSRDIDENLAERWLSFMYGVPGGLGTQYTDAKGRVHLAIRPSAASSMAATSLYYKAWFMQGSGPGFHNVYVTNSMSTKWGGWDLYTIDWHGGPAMGPLFDAP